VLCLLTHRGGKVFPRTFPELGKDFETTSRLRCVAWGTIRSGKARPTQILVRMEAIGKC